MVKRYKKFLESNNINSKIDLEGLISTSNDLIELFIELEDEYGFDIGSKIIFESSEYKEGKFVSLDRFDFDKVIITGSVKDVDLELVDKTRIFIEKKISRSGRGFYVEKILDYKVKKIYGRFKYGEIGRDLNGYNITPDGLWKNWLGRALIGSLMVDKSYDKDRFVKSKYNVNFEIHFEMIK